MGVDPLKKPAVFLDRDGVLNANRVEGGTTRPPESADALEILPGVPEALAKLRAAGFALVVVTNQPDVARGKQTRVEAEAINDKLRSLVEVDAVFACFHDDADRCACRKPKPGLLLDAAARLGLDAAASFIVGDRWSDVEAGRAAGCRTFLVATPFSRAERCTPDFTVSGLLEAADKILALVTSSTTLSEAR
ncbi:MAG TPA: HAD family hydrolase [Thermoanaerobaculia bacterium]|nr:HAD family hydrolase [Thermoanaerobaculia bacterium]